jgi:hypothetical protein
MSKAVLKQLSKNSKKKKEIIAFMANKYSIVRRLIAVFKKHIGIDNKLSQRELFAEVMGFEPKDISHLEGWAIWTMISECLHLLRQRTKCQPISENIHGVRYYWVANSWSDAKIYSDFLDTQIKAMHRAKHRMSRAIEEKWWEQEWVYK